MTQAIIEILARLVPFAIGWFLIGAYLAWRTRHERAALRPSTGNPYRAPFASAGQSPASDPGEAWQAGVAAERKRVLVIVETARSSCSEDSGKMVADAVRHAISA